MASKTSQYIEIDTLPGVQPSTDKTPSSTKHYVYSDKVRFVNGFARKIGGWISLPFDYGVQVLGTARSLASYYISGKNYSTIGTEQKLYSLIGSRLTNITPLQTATIAVANSLATHYATLAANPIQTTAGSSIVTILDSEAALFTAGDLVTFSGATATGGITGPQINIQTLVRSVSVGSYTVNFGVVASSTATGGGAAVVRSSGLVTVTNAAHGQVNGDRVKITAATAFGGITAPQINLEFIIRNVATNTFDVFTGGTATSYVTAAGGAATLYQPEIPDGLVNEMASVGYGAGLYGAGLYGTALVSTTSRQFPRIWLQDRYANTFIMTPGNQGGLYQWFGNNNTAPQQISGAPTKVNYAFVSNNILVTFGADTGSGEIENRIFASDQNGITVWTSSSTNQVYDDDIEGAGRLISHCPVEGNNLIFTEHQTYTFRYIGLPNIWEILPLDESIGLIAPMANESVKGNAFWMGLENFYMYRGGAVEIIPANSQSESTCLRYVFDNLNWGQKSKIFAWYNKEYNEVWFEYPSAASNEPDRVVAVNLLDYTWSIHKISRTCAEYPTTQLKKPRLMNASGTPTTSTLYQHEYGKNDDAVTMPWEITGNYRYYGKDNANLVKVIPDSISNGDVNFEDIGYLFPQSPVPVVDTTNVTNTADVSTQFFPTQTSARFHQYHIFGNTLDQDWIQGQWLEEIQTGAEQ